MMHESVYNVVETPGIRPTSKMVILMRVEVMVKHMSV
jgi:hypothetical protein